MRRTAPAALVVLAALLGSRPVSADQPPMPGPRGVIVSADDRVVISSDVCTELGLPQPGVAGAAYTPGVDAGGNAVAPADVPTASAPLRLDDVPIAITTDLRKRFALPANDRLSPAGKPFGAEALIGIVVVRDGRAYVNDQPIGDGERDLLAAACREGRR